MTKNIIFTQFGNNRIYQSSSLRIWINTKRNSIALAFAVCLMFFYVIWTFSGNLSTSDGSLRYSREQKNFISSYSASGEKSSSNHLKRTPLSQDFNINGTMAVCRENFEDTRKYIQNHPRSDFNNLSIIYFVTPTYPRREQFPELIRLAHTLMHIPQIHWIIANDFDRCSAELDSLIINFGLPFTTLSSPMPEIYRSNSPSPRGVSNRRAALNWIRNKNIVDGILYFGDDDNTFDLKLFSEIRNTKKVSMFPVGLIGRYAVSTPVVKKSKVIGFYDSWPAKRRWPVDMAGFAVNLKHMSQHPNATMPYKAGFEEDAFLRSMSLRIDEIEVKANNCTEILVWHTQTQKGKAALVQIDLQYLDDSTNLGSLFKELHTMGLSYPSAAEDAIKAEITKNGKAHPVEYFFQ